MHMKFYKPEHRKYSAPKVAIVSLKIERGFSASLENPFEDPEQDW